MPLLKPGDQFPELRLNPVDGTPLTLPDGLRGKYGVVLIYRGSWCPYCNAQLRAFARANDELAGVDAAVVALSVDDEITTKELVGKLKLPFPVGYGADPDEVAARTGAFVHDDPKYLESTGFVLNPEGRVLTSVYSSNAIGRLVPEDVIGMIRYVRDNTAH